MIELQEIKIKDRYTVLLRFLDKSTEDYYIVKIHQEMFTKSMDQYRETEYNNYWIEQNQIHLGKLEKKLGIIIEGP